MLFVVPVSGREHAAQAVADFRREKPLFAGFRHAGFRPVAVCGDAGSDDPVVEFHDSPQAPVVRLQRRLFRLPETFGYTVTENPPVAAPPTVDRLFDVPDQQHGRIVGLREGILEQRDEIFPLLHRRVLKFVDHKVRKGVARFLVNERRVVVADQPVQNRVGFRDGDEVLLGAYFGDFLREIVQQRETAVIVLHQPGRVHQADVGVVDRT